MRLPGPAQRATGADLQRGGASGRSERLPAGFLGLAQRCGQGVFGDQVRINYTGTGAGGLRNCTY